MAIPTCRASSSARRLFKSASAWPSRPSSGSFLPPVSRFHSSKVSFEIFPFTRSSANLRRCAWLLNGMVFILLLGRDRLQAAFPDGGDDGRRGEESDQGSCRLRMFGARRDAGGKHGDFLDLGRQRSDVGDSRRALSLV